MINLILQRKQFLLYCVIGFSGVGLDTCVFALLYKSGLLGYQAANAISYTCGTLLSFILNARYNFRVTDKIAQRMATFFGVAFLGWLVSALLLHVMVYDFHVDKFNLTLPNGRVLCNGTVLAKIATLPVIVVLQYSLNRMISFRKVSKAS